MQKFLMLQLVPNTPQYTSLPLNVQPLDGWMPVDSNVHHPAHPDLGSAEEDPQVKHRFSGSDLILDPPPGADTDRNRGRPQPQP